MKHDPLNESQNITTTAVLMWCLYGCATHTFSRSRGDTEWLSNRSHYISFWFLDFLYSKAQQWHALNLPIRECVLQMMDEFFEYAAHLDRNLNGSKSHKGEQGRRNQLYRTVTRFSTHDTMCVWCMWNSCGPLLAKHTLQVVHTIHPCLTLLMQHKQFT